MPAKRIVIQLAIAIFIAALVLFPGFASPAFAHGAKIEYTIGMSVDIVAMYDSGEPMGGAQVAVYAPGDPSHPWLTGVCDDQGRFSFTPDTSLPGTWDVQVRQAGHGDITHIPVGAGSDGSSEGGNTPLQIVLMSLCVVWGCIGTALFFMRRKA
ncbi:MAG: carboxypeptidase regulatory-like domain-containing protein [Dehalococcoidales bacterium]|nr:carboxypeptidase regulatory-like domain-containing protein [Dehalococcoidales bacterium]